MSSILPFPLYIIPLLLCFLITTGISIIVGLIGHFLYWILFELLFSFTKQRKLKWINNQRDEDYYAIIIGTGFSGLGMAIKMNKLGMHNYILLERHGRVGGTWYANQYSGWGCEGEE